MKILVVDDDPALRYSLARILVKGGYEVVMADDGDHGLALFHKERPDLVICDLIMPHRNGIETIAQMRRESPAMKIIAITGGQRTASASANSDGAMNADGLAAALENGASDVIVKPFRADDLLSLVTSALGG